MAMNSPSATDERHVAQRQDFAVLALEPVAFGQVVDGQFNHVLLNAAYLNASFALRSSSALIAGPNSFSKNPSFTSRSTMLLSIDLVEVVGLHLRGDLRIGLLRHDRFDGGGQHVGHALEGLGLGVEIVDALHVGLGLLVVRHVGFHGEGLVFIEALDGFGLRLDDLLRQLGVGLDPLFFNR